MAIFPRVRIPTPEIREAMQKGIDLCEEVHPDLLLATHLDADRVGVACKDGDDYTLLTGNEMGVVLLDYSLACVVNAARICPIRLRSRLSCLPAMVDALAAEYGFELRRCLTGSNTSATSSPSRCRARPTINFRIRKLGLVMGR